MSLIINGFDKVAAFQSSIDTTSHKAVVYTKQAAAKTGFAVLGVTGFFAKIYAIAMDKLCTAAQTYGPKKHTEYFAQKAAEYKIASLENDSIMLKCFEAMSDVEFVAHPVRA